MYAPVLYAPLARIFFHDGIEHVFIDEYSEALDRFATQMTRVIIPALATAQRFHAERIAKAFQPFITMNSAIYARPGDSPARALRRTETAKRSAMNSAYRQKTKHRSRQRQ